MHGGPFNSRWVEVVARGRTLSSRSGQDRPALKQSWLERRSGQWRRIPSTPGACMPSRLLRGAGADARGSTPGRALRRDTNSLLLPGGVRVGDHPRSFTRVAAGIRAPVPSSPSEMSSAGRARWRPSPTKSGKRNDGLNAMTIGRTGSRPHVNRFPLLDQNVPLGRGAQHHCRERPRSLPRGMGPRRRLQQVPTLQGPHPADTSAGARTFLVKRPLFHPDPAHPRLVSLLIRARVECRTSAP